MPVPLPLLASPEPPPPVVVLPLTLALPLLAVWVLVLQMTTVFELLTRLLSVVLLVTLLLEPGPVLLMVPLGPTGFEFPFRRQSHQNHQNLRPRKEYLSVYRMN
jgi:hypothetical protein